MDETGKKLLALMFKEGESVCVSPNKYGWHSIPLKEAMDGEIILRPPDETKKPITCHSSELTLVALNPIDGFRNDSSVKSFRNILVEIDVGEIKDQILHLKTLKLPISATVFSGNKSVHALISLSEDFKDEEEYRMYSRWILNAIPLADQKTFNPSRSIRIPGAYREPGKKQRLIELNGPIARADLEKWLNKHMDAKPENETVREKSDDFDFKKIRPWARSKLINGIDKRKGRSAQWYAIGFEFCLSGYSLDATIRILRQFFHPEHDFKEKEWRTTIKSAFKRADKK